MELKIDVDELKKHKLFIGTPMYGGMCSGLFARSIGDLSAICSHYGIQLQLYFLFNESLITRARNYISDEFMRSDCTHLMFIDADIGFDARDVIALMTLMIQNKGNYDIMGGPYPKKCISWEKIKQAVDKGLADNNPNDLEKFVGDFVFNPKNGANQIQLGEPAEVLEIGTGFMMIDKDVMTKFKDAYWEQYRYNPDHVRTDHFDGHRQIMQFFQAERVPTGNDTFRYLSEDYWFTQKAQQIGLKTWLCPWMKLQHLGSYVFGGSLVDLAQAGASATADVGLIKNQSKGK